MIGALGKGHLYVSEKDEFDLGSCILCDPKLVLNANGHQGVHEIKSSWPASQLPKHIGSVGTVMEKDGGLIEGIFEKVEIQTQNMDELEVIVQEELTNSEQLREWFL